MVEYEPPRFGPGDGGKYTTDGDYEPIDESPIVHGTSIPTDPTARLGFEVNPQTAAWSFAPVYYPDRFVQTKDRDLNRDGRQCAGENVSLKAIKNREFHATGVILSSEIPIFQKILDYDGKVEIISPLTPGGGMECEIKHSELGEEVGFNPTEREWMFKYTFDLVSTGFDEYDTGQNAIITAISESAVSDTNLTSEGGHTIQR